MPHGGVAAPSDCGTPNGGRSANSEHGVPRGRCIRALMVWLLSMAVHPPIASVGAPAPIGNGESVRTVNLCNVQSRDLSLFSTHHVAYATPGRVEIPINTRSVLAGYLRQPTRPARSYAPSCPFPTRP